MINTQQLDFLDALGVAHERDAPLGPRTWYGIGGAAQVLAQPSSIEQLQALVQQCHARGVPMYVLGSGANLLVADAGVPGVVIEMMGEAFAQWQVEGSRLTAGAGCDLFKLAPAMSKRGLAGLDVLAGIPASVGGAVRMNAGGTFGEIGACVHSVRVMAADGTIRTLDHDALSFGYRHSNIAEPIILSVEFALTPGDPATLHARFKEIFAHKSKSQPMGENSAGCAFRNPPADAAGSATRGAGQLIDQAGLKGYRVGGAYVSSRHANFVVAEKHATASDVLAVMAHVQRVVQERFGVTLRREVVVWP